MKCKDFRTATLPLLVFVIVHSIQGRLVDVIVRSPDLTRECEYPVRIQVTIVDHKQKTELDLSLETVVQDDKIPMYVARPDESGHMVILHETVFKLQDSREYMDLVHQAALQVSCLMTTTDTPYFKFSGEVVFPDGRVYDLQPDNTLLSNTLVYILTEVETNLKDLQFDIPLREDALLPENDPELDSFERRTLTKEGSKDWKMRSKREAEQIYIDLVLYLDYSVYQRFSLLSQHNDTQLLDADVKDQMRRFFGHLVNQMNLRYKTASDEYNIQLKGFIIEDQGPAAWLKPILNNNTLDAEGIDAKILITNFTNWKNAAVDFPSNDHLMLFTAHTLFRTFKIDGSIYRILGLAYIGTACKYPSLSTSAVLFTGKMTDDMVVASHELGHSLSAGHDGWDNMCLSEDGYIMAPSYIGWFELGQINHYFFSSCTIDEFRSYFTNILLQNDTALHERRRRCLLESLSPVGVVNVSGEMPGQLFDVHQQCKLYKGPESHVLTDSPDFNETYQTVCQRLGCYDSSDEYYYVRSAAEGTTCGNKMVSGNNV